MKKITSLLFMNFLIAQVSISDINNINNAQLDLIKDQLKTPTEVSELGTDMDIQSVAPDIVNISNSDEELVDKNETSSKDNESILSEKDVLLKEHFGYDYFEREVSFFDNAPPGGDYILGSGDEIIISLWGEHNLQKNFIINKNGMIYYDSIGYISVSGKDLAEAEKIITERLSLIYSTLSDGSNSTSLRLEVGKLKSINVLFSGNVNEPGIHLIHPFSDVFLGLVQSGGVAISGSLREIELIRNNSVIYKVDLYSFFKSGISDFKNIKLIDGDTIHVPNVEKRVKIEGPFKSNKIYFEVIKNETIKQLVYYADGLKSNATSYFMVKNTTPISERIFDDYAQNTFIVQHDKMDSYKLKDGDVVAVKDIGEVQSSVEVLGRTKIRGIFPANGLSLKDVLNLAGGFNDPVYIKSINTDQIIILRKTNKSFYGEEYKVSYSESDSFELEPDDKIFVYENTKFDENGTVRIEGEVNYQGTYPLSSNMSLKDLINVAGGLTPNADLTNVSLLIESTTVDSLGVATVESAPVYNINEDYKLSKNAVVKILPKVDFIRVDGNVYNPGLIVFEEKMTMKDAIDLAGGYMPYSLKNRIFVKKANGQIQKPNILRGAGKRLSSGDTVFVPKDPNPDEFNVTAFISDFASVMANIAAIIVIVNNN
jgi:protein involved in polysaccharide export with SLBB domain